VRTATEFAKLLYALDPHGDPHGALLHLDFLALKTAQPAWALDLWAAHAARTGSAYVGRMNVTALPGWAYARALALRMTEDTEKDAVGSVCTI
jgi:hypothetical protein